MCGLIAAWDPAGLTGAPLSLALADLRHRGPDAQAYLWREEHRLHLAHARLKIIDTTDGANQPFVSPCGRWAIAFNGEIYNFRELRNEISDRWIWRTHSDTEVLMAAWTLWGEDCLQRLVGMFAFVIHDADEHILTLVRDRFGIKPLYCVAVGTRRVFASEIPPLLRFQPAAADESTIRTYLELGLYDHGTHTFFKGVRSLEPGALIRLDLRNGSETNRRWYNLAEHVPDLSGATEKELTDRTEELVLQAVSSHLVADVEVGLNVSGGVDSSMLTRLAIAELGVAHLFTQDYAGYSEAPWVREIASGGVLHISELSFEHIDSLLLSTCAIQAEPFGGVTVCGYDELYAAACAQGVTVLLDGNGVDEAFLGYDRYHQAWVWSANNEVEREHRADGYRTFWGRMAAPPLTTGGVAIDGTRSTCPEAISPNLLDSADLAPQAAIVGFECPIKNLAATDLFHNKIPRGLRFNDRMSMARSRELRVPFLDHRLVEFAYGVPTNYLLNERGSKAIFREVAARHMPTAVAFGAKRSVQSPQREWIANEWRGRIDDLLNSTSFADRGWVDPAVARHAWDRYLGGARDNSFPIWQWLGLEYWANAFLDKSH